MVDVTTLGIAKDGSLNSAATISAMLDTAQADGILLEFPRGEYRANRWDFTGRKHISMQMAPLADFIGDDVTGQFIFGCDGGASQANSTTELAITGGDYRVYAGAGKSYSDCVRFNSMTDCTIRMPMAFGQAISRSLYWLEYLWDNTFSDFHFGSGTETIPFGIAFPGNSENNNTIVGRRMAGAGPTPSAGTGIYLSGNANRLIGVDLSLWNIGLELNKSNGCYVHGHWESAGTAIRQRPSTVARTFALTLSGSITASVIGLDLHAAGNAAAHVNLNASGLYIDTCTTALRAVQSQLSGFSAPAFGPNAGEIQWL